MATNETYSTCYHCCKTIFYGSAYISLNRNIEQIEHSFVNNVDEIEVLHSEEILTLCGSCGNCFDTEILVQLIRLIPGRSLLN